MFSKKKTIVLDLGKEMNINLHTCFVFFPINVYFLNEKKELVETKENFKPFSIYTSKKKARYAVESSKKLKEIPNW